MLWVSFVLTFNKEFRSIKAFIYPLFSFHVSVKQVEKSAEMCAVETLLICDSLFRSTDPLERKKYVDIVESVKGCGGTVHILPSRHIAGEGKFHHHNLVLMAYG